MIIHVFYQVVDQKLLAWPFSLRAIGPQTPLMHFQVYLSQSFLEVLQTIGMLSLIL